MTVAPRRDALAMWLTDCAQSHPLKQEGFPVQYLDALDDIVGLLEKSQPLRIARKREAFRTLTTFDELFEQRAELLAASLLVRAGIGFEFAIDHPDLVIGGGACGVEVGTRTLDSPWAIHDELEVRLADRGDLHVMVKFDGRPLKLGAAREAQIVEQISCQAFSQPITNIRFPDAGLTVSVMTRTGRSQPQVTLRFGETLGSELTDHMAEVEREIDNKLREKQRQAAKMPTLLLLDFSRTGWAWVRPGHVWLPRLRAKLRGQPYAGLGLMVSTLDAALPMQLHAVLSHSAPRELTDVLNRVKAAVALATRQQRPPPRAIASPAAPSAAAASG